MKTIAKLNSWFKILSVLFLAGFSANQLVGQSIDVQTHYLILANQLDYCQDGFAYGDGYLKVELNNDNLSAGNEVVFTLTLSEQNSLRQDTAINFTGTVGGGNSTIFTFPYKLYLPGAEEYNFNAQLLMTAQGVSLNANYETSIQYGTELCSTASGVVYIDENANCELDGQDTRLANRNVKVFFNDKEEIVVTDANGKYEFQVQKNTGIFVNVQVPDYIQGNSANQYHQITCSSSTYYQIFYDSINPMDNYHFAYKKEVDSFSETAFVLRNSFTQVFDPCGDSAYYGAFYVRVDSNLTNLEAILDFGDGTSKGFDLIGQSASLYYQHLYPGPGYYLPKLILKQETISESYNLDPLYISDSCGTVSGQVYFDKNFNCQKDANEDVLEQIQIQCISEGIEYKALSNPLGKFGFTIPFPADYEVQLASSEQDGVTYYSGKYPNATPCPQSYTDNKAKSDVEFGLQCNTHDLDAYALIGRNRPGFVVKHRLVARNVGCTDAQNVQLTYELNDQDNYLSSSIEPDQISGNTLTWNFDQLAVSESQIILLETKIPPGTSLGDTLCRELNVSSNATELKLSNNNHKPCSEVTGSYDPNDLTSYVNGEWSFTPFFEPGDFLTYRIRFQNTGTDTAFTVLITDTLSSFLDKSTMEIIAASHSLIPIVSDDDVIQFLFQDILLPDSTTNLVESNGFVEFKIRPIEDIEPNDIIENTANIYFDFNEPIITNTTQNQLGAGSDIKETTSGNTFISLYPNPASTTIKLQGELHKENLEIYSIHGKRVKMISEYSSGEEINIADLEPGIYQIVFPRVNGSSNLKLLVSPKN